MQATDVLVVEAGGGLVLLGGNLQDALVDLAQRHTLSRQLGDDNELKQSIMFNWLAGLAAQQEQRIQFLFDHLKAVATLTGYTDLPTEFPVEPDTTVYAELHAALNATIQEAVDKAKLPPQPDVPQ